MTTSERTIVLDIDDLEEIDAWGSVNEWQSNYGPSQGLVRRVYRAIYDARPPEPQTVVLNSITFEFTDRWEYDSGGEVPRSSHLYAALTRIWELEHPDKEADR